MSASHRAKVLYISPVAERGGAETVLLNILKFHDRRLFEPLVCFLRSGPVVDQVHQLGVRSILVKSARIRNVRQTLDVVRAVRRVITSEHVDIVFGNLGTGHVFGGLAAIGTAAKSVWFQHGIASLRDPLDWLAALIPSARIYVNSRATAAAQARLPRGGARVQLLYCGVDCSRFSPSPNGSRPLLGALGISARAPVVAMVARFQQWKGQDVLLHAAAKVIDECPDVRFVLVGDALFGLEPEFKRHLHQLVEKLKLASHVTFVGFRDDIPALLDEVDIVVHSHRAPEPFGLAVVEALLMEKPVITSDLGGPAEIITDGETGLLIPPGDAPSLARSIVGLVRDPARRIALGRAGRAAMVGRFTMERMIGELEASYRQLLN